MQLLQRLIDGEAGRWVPRRKVAEEQRNKAEDLQRCFDLVHGHLIEAANRRAREVNREMGEAQP